MKKNKGVTIIALVITVIVLLILAGISIATLSGEEGILTQAENAKLQTEISEDKEQLELHYVEKVGTDIKEDVTIEDYLDYLEEQGIKTKEEEGKFYVEVEGKIYEIKEENYEIKIEYIGNGEITEPRIQKINIVEKTLTSVEIEVKAVRMEGGTYTYYIGTDKENLENKGSNQTAEFKFEGLTQGQTYYIKVEGENVEGKKATKTIETTLEKIPSAEGKINYTVRWNEGSATVTLTTTSGYTIENSKNNITYTAGTIVTGLKHGDTVYARLTNGTYAGEAIQIPIRDTEKPEITISKGEVTTKSIAITAKATDKESGISTSENYKYYISNAAGEIGTTAQGSNQTGVYTFDNLDQNTEYTIKVEIQDIAGNKQEATIKIQTKLIPSAETAITREVRWNSDGTAQVILSTQTEFNILYSTDRNSWNSYPQTGITVNNGSRIYMCLTDGRNNGADYGLEIVDKEGPEITLTRGSVSSNSITVNVQANDAVSGMPNPAQYNYYIKTSAEEAYRLVGENITNTTYTFGGLTEQTTYNIKVTAKDLVGNEGESTLDATTNEFTYTTGNIQIGAVTWANKEATVPLTNNTDYIMEYKTVETGAIDLSGTWEKAENKTVNVTNLKNGYRVIARLTDGVNTTTGYATILITDTNKPTVEITGNTTEWTNENITLTINAQDNESGLQENAYSFDGGTTWQSEKTKIYEQNTAGISIKVRDEAGNIAEQTITIDKIDKQGPAVDIETEATSNTITVKIESVTDSGVGMVQTPEYRYYIATNSAELETMQPTKTTTDKTVTFDERTQNTTYYIKVEAEDILGNISKTYRTVSTGALTASTTDLTITDPVWQDKKASVEITNNSNYNMQYQVVKAGETFNQDGNWTLIENENTATSEVTAITDLLHGDTVYARLTDGYNVSGTIIKEIKDETAPTIEVTGNTTEWTTENITLTINAQDTESGLQENAYSFDGGTTWQSSNTKVYEENATGISIKVRDEAGNIAEQTIVIDKIDKQGPNVTIESSNITTKQATITVTAEDSGVGMAETPTYTYYIKEGATQEETQSTEGFTKVEGATQETYTFDNLKANTTYTIKVETEDILGNKTEETTEITTRNLIYQQDITFTNIIWSNGIATVTAINAREEYDMEYQIGKAGAGINLNGSWTKVTEKTIDIGNLEDGDKIYARLTDGVNVTTGYATGNVDNSAKETYTEQELAEQTTRKEYDILGISVSNNELRLQIEKEQENASTYTYYYKTINEDEYKLISTSTNYNDPAVITDIEEGAIYKIKVLVQEEGGTVTRSENTATMIALGEAEKDQTYTNNRTYIDNSKTIEVLKTAGTGTVGNKETEQVQAGYTVSLAENFRVSGTEGETTEENGVVIKDSSNNEYVWIPVNDAIYNGTTDMPTSSGTASRTYKPMAIKQNGYENYYESIIYTFNNVNSWRNSSNTGLGKTSYREPSLVTNNANDGYTWNVQNAIGVTYDGSEENYKNILGFNTITEFGEYIASNYNNMVTAVDSYGGFYVGRYETTVDSTNNAESSSDAVVVASKPNNKPLSETNWYRMYLYQDNQKYEQNPYYGMASVTSSMIWGSQWDAMLNYILKGNENNKVTTQIASQKNIQSNSAQDTNDIINNIYDLSSNTYEWTQEASETNARIYRGGSYDSSVSTANASTRRNSNPLDQGPVFGTRLALYVKSTNDTTGPATKINNITSTSNTITVEVSATDKETGVDRYKYYISEDGSSWGTAVETSATNYTYTGVLQNTTYYIKVEAVDGAGNVGEGAETQIQTKSLGAVAKEGITRNQKYGPNGSGIVQLTLASEYLSSGYYIEYQVVEGNTTEGATAPIEGQWQQGDTINNLSNGQKIYARIYDGVNSSEDYFEEIVEGLEEYGYIDAQGNTYTQEEAMQEENKGKTTYDTTIEYTDPEQNTATIPAGFKVGISDSVNKINNGLVIKDQTGNEFVWVPVETAIETDSSVDSEEKAMARYQSGYTQDSAKKYYEGILYDFSGTSSTKKRATTALGTSANREPTLLTGGNDYTWNILTGGATGRGSDAQEHNYKNMGFGTTSGVEVFSSYTEFGQYMNAQYTNMIQSVDKYKGFYVGRYETSLEGTEGNKAAVVQSQIGKTPIYNQSWYRDYYYQDSNINPKNPYNISTSVRSSMIWGSQWDAMMNWMLKDDNTKNFVTEITGNHEQEVALTGSYTNDLAKNIFDLSSNMAEWTQEGSANNYREQRGGYAVSVSDKCGSFMASSRITAYRTPAMTAVYSNPTNIGEATQVHYLGSRMTLYIKNTEDTSEPSVELENVSVGTNNIEITVNAIDNESGIDKYKYSISYKNFENDSTFNNETDILNTVETYGNTYKVEDLLQGQTYYIKVEVLNGVGLTNVLYTGAIQTEQIDLQEGDITLEKVWGKDTEGKAYFELAEEFESEGYTLEHQVVKQGEIYKDGDEYWSQQGDTISSLSVGDTIYTRITDGINKVDTSSYKTSNISELETFSETYTQNTKVRNSNSTGRI